MSQPNKQLFNESNLQPTKNRLHRGRSHEFFLYFMDGQILRQFCLVFEISINTNPWETGLMNELLINLIYVKKARVSEK